MVQQRKKSRKRGESGAPKGGRPFSPDTRQSLIKRSGKMYLRRVKNIAQVKEKDGRNISRSRSFII